MIHDLHERGIKVLLWQIPLQKAEQSDSALAQAQRDSLLASGHMVREADGSAYRTRGWWFPGAYLPGRRWWTEQRRYLVEDLGVDGFKTDGGEHAWGHDLCYANGQRGDEANNLFPVHYAAAYGELLRSAGKDPVTFMGSSGPGTRTRPGRRSGPRLPLGSRLALAASCTGAGISEVSPGRSRTPSSICVPLLRRR